MKKGRGFGRKARAQSALEYMVTYGWAILIIALILVVLFFIGVFGGAPVTTTSCVATSGYTCGSPVMNTLGYLQVSLGQTSVSVSTLSVTGLGCSNSTSAPSTYVSSNIGIASGRQAAAVFKCPLTKTGVLGAPFSGTLWIRYTSSSQPGQTYTIEVATLTTTATTQGSVGVAPGGGGGPSNTCTGSGTNTLTVTSNFILASVPNSISSVSYTLYGGGGGGSWSTTGSSSTSGTGSFSITSGQALAIYAGGGGGGGSFSWGGGGGSGYYGGGGGGGSSH